MAKLTRREFIAATTTAAAGLALPPALQGREKPFRAAAAPVSVVRCKSYARSELLPAMTKLLDGVGGLSRLVKGKTVGVKINLTSTASYRLGYLPAGETHWTHPDVLAATVHLMGRAGARRIRILEGPISTADPVEEFLLLADWEPREILRAAPRVEFENTNFLGQGKKYSRLKVPHGGLFFPAFDLNHSYEDCDVFVTMTKMKEHGTVGLVGSMKNQFGITPSSIYAAGAGEFEPNESPRGSRQLLHNGSREPSKSAPQKIDKTGSKDQGYRVPRIVVDLVAARPIDLAIVEGIKSMTGGEGPWWAGATAVSPGLLVAGTNCVSTDAVCTGLMGYDPMADRGKPPFEACDNILRLAEEVGLGTRDLRRIEVVGPRIEEAYFDFAAIRRARMKKS